MEWLSDLDIIEYSKIKNKKYLKCLDGMILKKIFLINYWMFI